MSLNHLKKFGCTSFVHIKRTDKLDKNAVKTIFLGYSTKQKVINAITRLINFFISLEMSFSLNKNHTTKGIQMKLLDLT
jgi:hypothetical protein